MSCIDRGVPMRVRVRQFTSHATYLRFTHRARLFHSVCGSHNPLVSHRTQAAGGRHREVHSRCHRARHFAKSGCDCFSSDAVARPQTTHAISFTHALQVRKELPLTTHATRTRLKLVPALPPRALRLPARARETSFTVQNNDWEICPMKCQQVNRIWDWILAL